MPQPKPTSPWFSRWDLLPLALGLVLLGALPSLLRGLPDPLPTHFNGAGRPNGWTPHRALPFLILGLPAFVWGLLLLVGRAFVGTEQDPDGRKSAAMAPLRGLLPAGFMVLLLSVTAIPRYGLGVLWVTLGGFVALLVLGVALMVRTMKREGLEGPNAEHYRWGLFYMNPDDPAIWVPKRLGLGWTLNFAHAASWWMLLLLLLPLLVVVALSRFQAS
jgi:uncharacterized membrane protein